jgi:MtrB/PioB family decaheme-associated outer membrane protein
VSKLPVAAVAGGIIEGEIMVDSALTNKGVLLLTLWMYLIPVAAEESAADVPWENWPCKFCPDTTGTEGWIEPGIGYQSDDSYMFGRYTGLEEEGLFGNASGYIRHREEDGRYYEIRGRNLGIDSRDIRIEAGEQGSYRLNLEYDQLPSFNDDTTSSPFSNSGNNLTLPQNWVPGADTQSMPTLQQSLGDVDIKTERKRLQANFAYNPARKWEITARLKHEKKDGTQDLGGLIGFAQTSILPIPVEHETNELGLGIGYTGKKLQAQIAYDGSFFEQDNTGTRWQNPYDNPSASEGQSAQPPSNDYHKLSATLGYDVLPNTRLNAHLAIGRMSQDEDFLPFTINPGLAAPLPASDLDGEIDTTLVRLGVSSRPLHRLQLNASYTFSDRDNESSQNPYDYVITDNFNFGAVRENLPYSFKQQLFRSSAGYRLSSRADMSLGFDYDEMERSYQEVGETRDKTVWGELKFRPNDILNASVKYSYADRSNSGYGTVTQIPTQNPDMRLFNLAERKRNKVNAALTIMPVSAVTLGLSADYYKDDYDDTDLGLTEASGASYSVDLSWFINEHLTTTAYYNNEVLESNQAGSAGFASPDWFMNDENTTWTVGAGINWGVIPDKLDIGAELAYSDYTGKIDYDNAADYPDLESTLTSAQLHGTYRLKDNISLKLSYRYEDYSGDDWAKDGIGVASVPTVLGLGNDTQDYDVHVIAVSIRYDLE